MGIPKVTVGTPLCCPVSKLLGDLESLGVIPDRSRKVTKQVASVAEVTAGAPHRLPIAKASHQLEIFPENNILFFYHVSVLL